MQGAREGRRGGWGTGRADAEEGARGRGRRMEDVVGWGGGGGRRGEGGRRRETRRKGGKKHLSGYSAQAWLRLGWGLGSRLNLVLVILLCPLGSRLELVFFFFFNLYFMYLFCFLGPLPRQMEVPGLGGRIRATAASLYHSHGNAGSQPCLCLHHSSPQLQTFNPLSEARDRTRNLMVPGQINFHCATTGTPPRL